MNNLHEIIEKEAVDKGIISFARFMELALYCPKFGYYEQRDVSPGKGGDFYTSVSVGPLFGEMLACQFAEWLDVLAGDQKQIVEAGAHDGRLALDILRWLQTCKPSTLELSQYWIIEPSAERKEWQEKTLGELVNHVRWFESWDTIPDGGVNGIIFSNELLDAMPVHRLGWDAKKQCWFEWGVAVGQGRFEWVRMPTDDECSVIARSIQIPKELEAVLPDGFTTEVSPVALRWWRKATAALKSGKLLAIDYGLMEEQFFLPQRREGTLRAYYQHHLASDLLANVGRQDITAQVNFSAVQRVGEKEGLRTEGITAQSSFLTAIAQKLLTAEGGGRWNSTRVRQFQTLTHPEHLGRAFRVLVQSR